MKRTRTATMVALMLLISLFAGCAAPAATAVPPTSTSTPPTATAVPPTATPVPATPTVAAPVLQITGPGGSKSLSLADIKALPATEGQAGIKSSTGKITLPELYKGVSLKDLMAALGGFDASTGVNVVAKDGYGITFSYDQVMNGTFIAYDPSTGDELKAHDPLTAIIAYERKGQPMDPVQDGTLRLAIVSSKNNQVTDGHWSVKWVTTLEVKSLGEEWTLHLEGAITEEMDRATFESGASPNCHAQTWTDDKAQPWMGIPLWLLVGRVDDEVQHNGPAFNDALADAGYTVHVVSSDGKIVEFDSARVKRNDNIIVAITVNGNPLPDQYYPLRLVGSDLKKDEMAGKIMKIVIHLQETPALTPTVAITPTATVASAGSASGADLAVTGKVEQELALKEADLRAMEVVKITAEHPKKGMTDYEGVRLNALLDRAKVKSDAKKLVMTADDGFVAEVFLAEVKSCADCLVAFTDTSGKFNLVMPGLASSVWVKSIVQIQVQ
jgi:hypothetical protein